MTPAFITALEWDRLLELAAHEARSAPARQAMLGWVDPATWAPDLATARERQAETREITVWLDRDGLWGPLSGLEDPAAALDRLARGGVLELSELRTLRGWIHALDAWTAMPREESAGERFAGAVAGLPDPGPALRIVDRVLTPEGELSERASPELARIHGEMRAVKREIQVVLEQLLRTFAQRGVLQENFSDVRDGRYVLPVKISAQNDVDGIVYEASVSRQTVFVEPREVSLLNNRLRKLENARIQEIYAILTETSRELRPLQGELGRATAVMTHWDAVQARARSGRAWGGRPIDVTKARAFRLLGTAHPLLFRTLPPESVIRNDVVFGEPARALLLTGPNTGGKTVLLKTLGLAGVCARTGFPFPAAETPLVPFFDAFFADLGDAQSIEAHISSFSGHLLRFREILGGFSERSLVLLDELNTATDPEEGAALGRAFLETVLARGAVVVSTTHDPLLKALALDDARILNASMAFDEGARAPTYRLVLGVPGRSRALETAARLGIPEPVLALARSYLTDQHRQFETRLARLETDAAEADRLRREAQSARDEADRLRREWSERTRAQAGDLIDRTRQKLRRVLEQAQEEVRASVRRLEELRTRKEVDQARAGLNATFAAAMARIDSALTEESPELAAELARAAAAPAPEAARPAIAPGATVRIPRWKSTGQVTAILGDKVKVAMGAMQMTLALDEVEPLATGSAAPSTARSARTVRDLDRPAAPPPQIDLRGVRRDEALARLEQYLDQAFRSGAYVEVTVVHGLGTGAIREGARRLLSELPYVKSFQDGGTGRGGAGATVVEFDRSRL